MYHTTFVVQMAAGIKKKNVSVQVHNYFLNCYKPDSTAHMLFCISFLLYYE